MRSIVRSLYWTPHQFRYYSQKTKINETRPLVLVGQNVCLRHRSVGLGNVYSGRTRPLEVSVNKIMAVHIADALGSTD